ncbi:MAG: RNA polymerase sigma factor SigZ [Gracilimonas sp.]|uniref:RNA polymerase sigma factor SigZ n=1 Tax=Gracilimonas sp. TaxID=1974203 RepID=UPI0019C3036E|nr:RNA polymerase sigma factor SigZ [Gracilimonas sp.]MBD3617582.1 RNA polymerase sigma factor SigZ [Gracilimonas sp.]
MNTSSPTHTEKIWKEFSDHVRNFIRAKVATDDEAEDILQDIFTRIHQGIANLKHEDRVQSWVFGIARRALADHYRSKKKRENLKGEAATDETKEAEDIQLRNYEGEHDVHEEVLSWLIPMIDDLPEKYRIPLKMADVEGKSQQEIADEFELSLSGAKSRVQRGREKLGEILAACCEIEFGREGRAVAYRKVKKDSCESCE